MTVLIFGAKGYMGKHFLTIYPDAIASNVDIADVEAVSKELDKEKPDTVINCAGKTGHPNVDWCADHKLETIRSNLTGPLILLDECSKRNIYLVHMSTGCIYDGDNGGKGWSETDPPNFFGSFYSVSKAACDQILIHFPTYPSKLSHAERSGVLQLRIRMPFDSSNHPRNLLTKLQAYPKINAIPNSMTYVPDFLLAAEQLIAKHITGTYNIVNPGKLSPYDVMVIYKKLIDPSKLFEPFTPKNTEGAEKGNRSNCILSIQKLIKAGISMKPIDVAIHEALVKYKENASLKV